MIVSKAMLTDVAIINSTAIKAFVQVQKPRLLHKQTLVHRQSNYNELKMAKQSRAEQGKQQPIKQTVNDKRKRRSNRKQHNKGDGTIF